MLRILEQIGHWGATIPAARRGNDTIMGQTRSMKSRVKYVQIVMLNRTQS